MTKNRKKLFLLLILISMLLILTACNGGSSDSISSHTLTVQVDYNQSSPLMIELYDEEEMVANEEGDSAQFEVKNGTYTLKVYNDSTAKSKSVVINGSDHTVAVSFLDPTIPEDDWEPGAGWNLDWSDEFNDGDFDTNIWTRQRLMTPFNNELESYTGERSTAYEENGYMVLKATYDGGAYDQQGNYTSARVISNPGGQDGDSGADGKTFKYGKIAARIKLPGGKGIWPAFWMLGDNISETGGSTSWPQCGEIDILESGAKGDPNYGQGTVHGTVHRDPGTESNTAGYNEPVPAGSYTLADGELFKDDFHVFAIEWDQEEIIWKLDGIEFGRKDISSDIENEFHKNFYVLFNIAVGGHFTDTPDEKTGFPQYMYIDWIRHYTK